MPQANEYLNEHYPQNGVNNHGKTRAEITKLDLSEKKLTGQLDLSDFAQLEVLDCGWNQISELILPPSGSLQTLDCSDNQLTNLDLNNGVNLTELRVWKNQLTQIDLTGLTQLAEIRTSDNQLTTFNYEVLNPQTLTGLNLSQNNLPTTDLSVFSSLVNLEGLFIGNNKSEKINQNIYNRFIGSCQSLQQLTKLEVLDINNTDINAGVEYLPISIRHLFYDTKKRPNCQLKEIEEELDWFKNWKNFKDKEKLSLKLHHKWFNSVLLNNQEYQLIKILDKDYTLQSFQTELNQHKSFIFSNDNNSLLARWKQANLQQLTIHNLKTQLEQLKSQLSSGNNLNNQLSEQISFLEKQIQEAECLITQQKHEINQAYLNSFTENEQKHLKELIITHKDYLLARKNEALELDQLREKYYSLLLKLKNKLGIRFINSIDLILAKFESLYHKEWELATQINQKNSFITIQNNLESQLEEIKASINKIDQNINEQLLKKIKDSTQIINNYTEIKKQITYNGNITQSIVDVTNDEIGNFIPNIETTKQPELLNQIEQQPREF